MKFRKWLAILPILVLVLSACSRDPKVRAQRYVTNGNKFFDKGDYKGASIMYRGALKEDRRFGEAYYRLALTDLKLYNYGDAFKSLLDAVELQPDNSDAKVRLAELYLLSAIQKEPVERIKQDLDEATGLARKLVQQDPKSFEGHRILGQIALVKNDLPGAITEFETANSAKPLDSGLIVSYVQALAASDRFPEAEKLALQMIDRDKTYAPIYNVLYSQYVRRNRLDDAERILKLQAANNPQNGTYLLQLAGFYVAARRRDAADAVLRTLTNEKDHPDGHLLAGDFFYRMRELDRARAEYDAAIKAFPKDKVVYEKRLAELDARAGDTSGAGQRLTEILKDNPKDQEAVAMRASMRVASGNPDQVNMAVNDLQTLVNKSPQNYVLRYNLAQALHKRGDNDAAILQLEEVLKTHPEYARAHGLLADLYLSKGDNPKALKEANEVLSRNRNDLQGHLVRARALLRTTDRNQARQELDYIVKAFPENAEARYEVGYLDLTDKDYKAAEEIFGKLYKDNPKDHRGVFGVAQTLVDEHRVADAIAEMNKAITAEPNSPDLKLYLADLLASGKRYDEAIQIYQALLSQSPKSPQLLVRLGEVYRLKGDSSTAMEKFRAASQFAPNDAVPLLRLAQVLQSVGRTPEAEPVYEQILKITPDEPLALNNLAEIKADKGTDLDEALSLAQRARQRAPNSMDVADTLGWIYIKKHMSEEAVHDFQDLVSKDPGNPTFHYHYGMALLQKGDKLSAKRELEQALKDKPEKPQEAEIRDMLAQL